MLAGLLILVGIIGMWMKEGFSGVQELLSPFNVINYIAMIITVAPGLAQIHSESIYYIDSHKLIYLIHGEII